jgi:hypothetical protein
MTDSWHRVLLCVGVIVAGYALSYELLPKYSRRIALRLPATRTHSLREIDGTVLTLLWVAALASVCTLAMVILSVHPRQLVLNSNPRLFPYGVFLGFGEAGAGSLLCYVADRTLRALCSRNQLEFVADSVPSRSKEFFGKLRLLPRPLILLIALLYAASEEIMLRGALLVALQRLDGKWALLVPVVVSLSVQAFPCTTKNRTMFPFIGTLVSAPVHALLFMAVPDVRPLIVAQVTAMAITLGG